MDDRRHRPQQRRNILSFLSGYERAKASKEAPATVRKRTVSEPGTLCTKHSAEGPHKKHQGRFTQAFFRCFNPKYRRKSTDSPSIQSFASGISAASRPFSTGQPLRTMRGYSEDLVIRNYSRKSTTWEMAASAPPRAGWDSGDEMGFEDVDTFSYVDDPIEQTEASSGYKPQASKRHSRRKRATDDGTQGLASEIGHKGAKGDTSATLEDDTALEDAPGDECTRPHMNRVEDLEHCGAKWRSSHQELLAEESEASSSCNTLSTPSQSAEDVVYDSNIATENRDHRDMEAFCAPLFEDGTPANSITSEDNDDEVEAIKNSPPGPPFCDDPNPERTRTCTLFDAASEDHDEKVVTPKSSRKEIWPGDLVNINGGSPNKSSANSPTTAASLDPSDQAASGWATLFAEDHGSPNNSFGYIPESTSSLDIMNTAADEMGWAALITNNDLTLLRDDSPNSTTSDDVASPQEITKAVPLECIPEEDDEDCVGKDSIDDGGPVPISSPMLMSRPILISSSSTSTSSISVPMGSPSIEMSSPTALNEFDQPIRAEVPWVQFDHITSADSASDDKNAFTEPTDMIIFNVVARHADSEQWSRVQTPEAFRCPSTANEFERGQWGTSTIEISDLDKWVELSCAELGKSSVNAEVTSGNYDSDHIVSRFFFGEEVSERDALCEPMLKSSPENEVMQPEQGSGDTAILGCDGPASHFFFGEEVSKRDALCESMPKSSPKNEVMQPEEANEETAILGGDRPASRFLFGEEVSKRDALCESTLKSSPENEIMQPEEGNGDTAILGCDGPASRFFFGEELPKRDAFCESMPKSSPKNEVMQPEEANGETAILGGDAPASRFFFGEENSKRDALCESMLESSPETEVIQPEEANGGTAILGDDGQAGQANDSQLDPAAVISGHSPHYAEEPDENALGACALQTEIPISETNHENPTSDTGSELRPTVTSVMGQSRLGGVGVLSLHGRNSSARTRRLVRYERTTARPSLKRSTIPYDESSTKRSTKRSTNSRRPLFHEDCRIKLRPSSMLALRRREAAFAPLTHDSSTQTDVSCAVPGPSVNISTQTFGASLYGGGQQPVIQPWMLLSYAAVLMVVAHCLGAWIFHGRLQH